MNQFQKMCWRQCKKLLEKVRCSFTGPIPVQGKRETYVIVQFEFGSDRVELFIYVDEAGIMINGKSWRIFERADYRTEDELITAYAKHLSLLLHGD